MAGRPAYTLVLRPRDARSTVDRVLLAVDAQTSVPLRVQVFGSAAAPAFEVGFTDVSFATPAASVFAFTPPARVDRGPAGQPDRRTPLRGRGQGRRRSEGGARPTGDSAGADAAGARPTVHGTGWTSVVEIPAGTAPLRLGRSLDQLTTALPDGDHAISTALVNVLLTADGRTFLGAVPLAVLQETARTAG